MDKNRAPNRLIHETSPYLLQHACNPVDWFPWGREAFEKAKAEDKPVFLSIGYSTCHWCHVMAHECFEDEEVAEVLNRNYVCIKVDREERPDIDGYYMNVCQAMTGSGGWPLSVFLSADRSPFFSGTYFPKEDRAGMIGFLTLLKRIGILWRTERPELSETARKLGEAVLPEKIQSAPVEYDIPKRTMEGLENSFDEEYGGFSRAPKFPSPQNLLFLLRYADTAGSERALELCEKTLVSLRRGGIFDQVGFGFARYSTDRKWLIPHFEKMLYDNALLCMTYAECWELTRKPVYERTARETAVFLLSTMRAENGGFFSALDADSEEGEGIYYSFTPEEVHAALGIDADEFCRYYGITEQGNFEGRSIPNLLGPEIPEERREYLERCREKLLRFRSRRPPPSLDDKLITSRNGLAIAALACAGRIFGDSSFVNAARAAADFFLKQMLTEKGRLLVSYRGKPSPVLGFAEDYAFFLWGLTELYEACFDLKYLEAALKLNQVFLEHFRNEAGAGFRTTDREAEQMPAENVEIFDGATPSANAVQIYNLIRLARLSGQDSLEKTAVKVLESFMPRIRQAPWACPFAALDILYLDSGGTDAALTEGEGFDEMLGVLRSEFRPFLTVRVKGKTERAEASVCSQKACFPAVFTPHDLGKLLKK